MLWAGIVGTPVFDLVGGGGAPEAGEEFGGIGPEDLKLPFVFWLNREVRMPLVAVIGPPQKLFRIRQAWHLYRDGPSSVRRLEVRIDGELRYRSEDPAYRWRTGILDNRRVRARHETDGRDAERLEQPVLLGRHRRILSLHLVVVPEEVEQPVDEEHTELRFQIVAPFPGLPRRRVEADHDVAEHHRIAHLEAEHVGGFVLLAPLLVQLADEGIVAEEHAQFGVGPAQHGEQLAGIGTGPRRGGLHAFAAHGNRHQASSTSRGKPSLMGTSTAS